MKILLRICKNRCNNAVDYNQIYYIVVTLLQYRKIIMAPIIRVDEEIYTWLQKQARPFEDTPNSVLRRVAGLTSEPEIDQTQLKSRHPRIRGQQTRQSKFRPEILKILAYNGGELLRRSALKKIGNKMSERLTSYDKGNIKSGAIRWQKSAEWEVRVMREEGLLKPAKATTRGVWSLTDYGRKKASAL